MGRKRSSTGAVPAGNGQAAQKHARRGVSRIAAPPPTGPPPQDRDTRFAFFEQARGHTQYLGVETDGGRFMVAAADRGVGRSLFVKRGRPEFRVLRRAVSVVKILIGPEAIAGRPFVDVGANIGTTTIPALVSHSFGSAVACEPDEESYRLLRANLALNGLETHVRALPVAASNRIGRSSFVLTEDRSGESWVATDPEKIAAAEATRAARIAEDPTVVTEPQPRAPDEVSALEVVEVELVTLDHLADDGVIDRDRLGMLWIDAEGHEGHILEGAATLADRGVPIVFEFNPAGLDERGDRGKVHEVADRSYTHFVDVRRPEPDRSQGRFRLRPVGELAKHAERFLDPSQPGHFTDLLLLRLDDEQARLGANLPELMSPEGRLSERPVNRLE